MTAPLIPADYPAWLADLKNRIRKTRLRAALAVNSELIGLYWRIGRDILERSAASLWYGAGLVHRARRRRRTAQHLSRRRRHRRAGDGAAGLRDHARRRAGHGGEERDCPVGWLDAFKEAEIIVEVTHRSKRRLFGLAGLAPLRDEVAPPRRPEPGRGPGRPPAIRDEEALPPPPLLDRPLTPIERKAIDYSDLERWMAHADQVIRDTRRTLDALARGNVAPVSGRSQAAPGLHGNSPSGDLPESWLGEDQIGDHE
jgi:hypothetical protein